MLNSQTLVDEQITTEAGADHRRISQRVGQAGATAVTGTDRYSYDPILGNLIQIDDREGGVRTFTWDGYRRLREIRDGDVITARYHYDHQFRRIRAATQFNTAPFAFAYQGSKVIAIGLYQGPGQVQWTHAVGQGPTGPAFIKDLTGADMDYYIFTDHLGTPLAYKNANTGRVYINPQSPWGDSLANAPTRGSPYTGQNFTLPPDPLFPTSPLGLSGHFKDLDTGLIYMHHRFYSPALGHFLNPDFRAPDIYDPTTFTEPYAFAGGDPVLFMDGNGLERGMLVSAMVNDVRRSGSFIGRDQEKTEQAVRIIEKAMAVTPEEQALLKGAIQGAAVTMFILSLPISGPTMAAIGVGAMAAMSVYSGYERAQKGQSADEVVSGGLADGTGIGMIYAVMHNEDIVTGEDKNLTPEMRHELAGNFLGGAIIAPFSSTIRQGIVRMLPKGGKLWNRYMALEFVEMVHPRNYVAPIQETLKRSYVPLWRSGLNKELQDAITDTAGMTNTTIAVRSRPVLAHLFDGRYPAKPMAPKYKKSKARSFIERYTRKIPILRDLVAFTDRGFRYRGKEITISDLDPAFLMRDGKFLPENKAIEVGDLVNQFYRHKVWMHGDNYNGVLKGNLGARDVAKRDELVFLFGKDGFVGAVKYQKYIVAVYSARDRWGR
nr:RHS repeat-associated core domain-containing protein [Acanthopleuribacter pedis]